MTYDDFFRIIEIDDIEKESAINFLKYRGIQEQINVVNFLKEMTLNTITYSQVASTFRYDKRLRRIIYKYLGYIEEYCRAFICNKYELISDMPKNYQKIITKSERERSNYSPFVYETLKFCYFRTSLNIVFIANNKLNEAKPIDFLEEINPQDVKALINLRN